MQMKAAQEQNRLYCNTFFFAFVLMNIHASNVLVHLKTVHF